MTALDCLAGHGRRGHITSRAPGNQGGEQAVDNPAFCENCGAALSGGARFCEDCGQPVAPAVLPPSEPGPERREADEAWSDSELATSGRWPRLLTLGAVILLVVVGSLAAVRWLLPSIWKGKGQTGTVTTAPAQPPSAAEIEPARPADTVEQVLLADDCDDPQKGLLGVPGEGTPAYGLKGYEGGEYFIRNTEPERGASVVYVGTTFENTSLQVDARLEGETADRYVCLVCRFNAQEFGMYRLAVFPATGYYRLLRFDGSQVTSLGEGESSAIQRGTATNRLELSCVDGRIAAFANGTELAAVADDTYPSGWLSIGVGAEGLSGEVAEARFDNLVVLGR